jgi:hypothetical protein
MQQAFSGTRKGILLGRYPLFATIIRLLLVLSILCSNGAALSAPFIFAHPSEIQRQNIAHAAIVPPATFSPATHPIYNPPTTDR